MRFNPSPHSYRQSLVSMPHVAQLNPEMLAVGARGEVVRELQDRLMPVVIPGGAGRHLGSDYTNKYFGEATQAYVKKFQQAKGLTPDGMVGSQTWAALGVRSSSPAPVTAVMGGQSRATTPQALAEGPLPFYKKPWFAPVATGVGFVAVVVTVALFKD
jgi:murein L,D-transpeptidase YcbB/YkuD